MHFLTPSRFTEYELIDCGDFEKLERFGKYITIRPEPQALWDKKMTVREWEEMADVRFIPNSSYSGSWKKLKAMPDEWEMTYNLSKECHLNFHLALTNFKHIGIFPEQAVHWDYIYSKIKGVENPGGFKVLNLFAYTGGASLAAKAAGADVVHLDSVRQIIGWAKTNMELSGLNNIRWLIEDAMKFVKRELKRGTLYNGIILDPPAFGHGPDKEQWKLEDNLNEMVKSVIALLDTKNCFLIVNTYSLGLSPLILENLLSGVTGKVDCGELFLKSAHNNKLPVGIFGRYSIS
jgi:23S rRNA (cytosine1962-C5)-methyltransferase